jgi:hypothetical protein
LAKSGLDNNTQNNIMSNATRMVAADFSGKMTLEKAVQQQMAQRSGSGSGSRPAPASAPKVPEIGAVVKGYVYKGGNLNDPSSWAPQ